jgi:hypothetical protein
VKATGQVRKIWSQQSRDLEKDTIAAVERYEPMFHYPFKNIQLRRKNGGTVRLVFGEEIRAELENWLNQAWSEG